jgi:(p)ppGpp synthase/HD superfamily hydrolase
MTEVPPNDGTNEAVNDDIVSRARAFAIRAHGEQKYVDKPYVVHLDQVASLVTYMNNDSALVVAYLHDVVEDTSVTVDEVRVEFGDYVADCVVVVTDEPGSTRAERKAATNGKLAKVPNALFLALVVKAADRLANMYESAKDEGDKAKWQMYVKEYVPFRTAAYRPGLCDHLWVTMENLMGPLLAKEEGPLLGGTNSC